MTNASMAPRSRCAKLVALSLFLLAAVFVVGGPSAARDGRAFEAQMQVATEGLTPQEYLQRQEELNRWLQSELPSVALQAPMRVTLTRDEIDAVDNARRTPGTPLQIGLVKPLSPRLDVVELSRGQGDGQARRGPYGVVSRTGDGGFVWAVLIRAEGAGAIRVHVENMALPDNAALYYYSRGGEAFGAYTGAGPNRSGEFWTTAVFGDEAVLQLRVSGPAGDADLRNVSFSLTEVGLITAHFAGARKQEAAPPPKPPSFCGNPSCIVDATCFNTGPAEPAKDAVAKIEWIQGAFIFTCTGGLISDNDPAPAAKNYFLTANHCISKNNNAQNATFYFQFATSTCGGACPSNTGWTLKTTGSSVKVTGRKGDFTLLQLNADPPAGSVFLGWTSAPVAFSNGAQLHRISNPNFGPQVFSRHNVDTSAPTCSSWPRGERIYSRDQDVDPNTAGHQGAIDGGSSGSPVVNGSSQIVGQLSGTCGFNVNDPCDPVNNATVDGAFAFYFASVQPFLNP